MATTTIIPLHAGKGRTVATALGLTVSYVENPEKTDGGEWVTAYKCDPLIADAEFLFSKRQYVAITGRDQGARDVIGYHVRISFKPGETDAATANRIGYDLAMKLTHGHHAFVCCTHVDKHHIHSHIVINSTSLDCTKKFRNFKGSAFAIRRIGDHLCVENGLSIIRDPKPSRGSYANWQGDEKPPTNRKRLAGMIDGALSSGCKDFDAFLAAMKEAGAEVKRGKHLAFRLPGTERFVRCKSVGDDYTEDALRERIAGKRTVAPKAKKVTALPTSAKPNMLIDIQAKMQQGYGEGYRRWATTFNLKEAAKTLIFLQERGITDYDMLAEKASAAAEVFNTHSDRRKVIEARQKEISELQKHIGAYSKTREVYRQYRALLKDKRQAFFEEHREAVTLHQAAKKYFDAQGYGGDKMLPAMQTLKQEWATLDAERRTLSRDYRAEREEMISLQMAKQNVDSILGKTRQPMPNRDRDMER